MINKRNEQINNEELGMERKRMLGENSWEWEQGEPNLWGFKFIRLYDAVLKKLQPRGKNGRFLNYNANFHVL